MLPRSTFLVAVAIGLLSAIVCNALLRPAPSRRFQMITVNDLDLFLLDTYEGRVWESRPLPFSTEKLGWQEMTRLDTPPSLYGSENKKWARKTVSEFEKGWDIVELKDSLNNKLEELRANEASINARLEAIRQAAIESIGKDGVPVDPLVREMLESALTEPPGDNEEVKELKRNLSKVQSDIVNVENELLESDAK